MLKETAKFIPRRKSKHENKETDLAKAAYVVRLMYMGDIASRLEPEKPNWGKQRFQTVEERTILWKQLAVEKLGPYGDQALAIRASLEKAYEIREEKPVFVERFTSMVNFPENTNYLTRELLTDMLIAGVASAGSIQPTAIQKTLGEMAGLNPDQVFEQLLTLKVKRVVQDTRPQARRALAGTSQTS
jgi:hypothetical protein